MFFLVLYLLKQKQISMWIKQRTGTVNLLLTYWRGEREIFPESIICDPRNHKFVEKHSNHVMSTWFGAHFMVSASNITVIVIWTAPFSNFPSWLNSQNLCVPNKLHNNKPHLVYTRRWLTGDTRHLNSMFYACLDLSTV